MSDSLKAFKSASIDEDSSEELWFRITSGLTGASPWVAEFALSGVLFVFEFILELQKYIPPIKIIARIMMRPITGPTDRLLVGELLSGAPEVFIVLVSMILLSATLGARLIYN